MIHFKFQPCKPKELTQTKFLCVYYSRLLWDLELITEAV